MIVSNFDRNHVVFSMSALLGIGYGAWHFYYNSHQQRHAKRQYPPLCSAGVMETVDAITNGGIKDFMLRYFEKFGRIFRIPLPLPGLPMVVVVADTEDARAIYRDPTTTKPEILYKAMASFSSGHSISSLSEGDDWFHRRKGVNPAFAPKHVRRMNEVAMQVVTEWAQEKLKPLEYSESVSFDVGEEMIDMTLSVICEAAFDYRISADEMASLLVDMRQAWIEFTMKSAMNPLRQFITWLLPERQRAFRSAKNLQRFAFVVMKNYKENPSPTPETVLDMIMKNQNYQSDDERASDIVMILFAGHDTTGYTLALALRELAKNPDEQKRLRQSLSDTEQQPDSYLKAVISETMRVYPIVPVTGFKLMGRDWITQYRGYLIPKGSIVFISQIAITRDARIFDNPTAFQPSRWLQPSEQAKRALFPFSLGNRNCAGQALANAEINSVLPYLVKNFDFSVALEGEVLSAATVELKNCWITATKLIT